MSTMRITALYIIGILLSLNFGLTLKGNINSQRETNRLHNGAPRPHEPALVENDLIPRREDFHQISSPHREVNNIISTDNFSKIKSVEFDSLERNEVLELAELYGVSEKNAEERLIRESELSALIREIVSIEGSRVAAWGIDSSPNLTAWVRLIDHYDYLDATLEILKENPDIKIRLGANHAYRQLEEVVESIVKMDGEVNEQLPPILRDSIITADVNMQSNSVNVTVNQAAQELNLSMQSAQDKVTYVKNQLEGMFGIAIQVQLRTKN